MVIKMMNQKNWAMALVSAALATSASASDQMGWDGVHLVGGLSSSEKQVSTAFRGEIDVHYRLNNQCTAYGGYQDFGDLEQELPVVNPYYKTTTPEANLTFGGRCSPEGDPFDVMGQKFKLFGQFGLAYSLSHVDDVYGDAVLEEGDITPEWGIGIETQVGYFTAFAAYKQKLGHPIYDDIGAMTIGVNIPFSGVQRKVTKVLEVEPRKVRVSTIDPQTTAPKDELDMPGVQRAEGFPFGTSKQVEQKARAEEVEPEPTLQDAQLKGYYEAQYPEQWTLQLGVFCADYAKAKLTAYLEENSMPYRAESANEVGKGCQLFLAGEFDGKQAYYSAYEKIRKDLNIKIFRYIEPK